MININYYLNISSIFSMNSDSCITQSCSEEDAESEGGYDEQIIVVKKGIKKMHEVKGTLSADFKSNLVNVLALVQEHGNNLGDHFDENNNISSFVATIQNLCKSAKETIWNSKDEDSGEKKAMEKFMGMDKIGALEFEEKEDEEDTYTNQDNHIEITVVEEGGDIMIIVDFRSIVHIRKYIYNDIYIRMFGIAFRYNNNTDDIYITQHNEISAHFNDESRQLEYFEYNNDCYIGDLLFQYTSTGSSLCAKNQDVLIYEKSDDTTTIRIDGNIITCSEFNIGDLYELIIGSAQFNDFIIKIKKIITQEEGKEIFTCEGKGKELTLTRHEAGEITSDVDTAFNAEKKEAAKPVIELLINKLTELIEATKKKQKSEQGKLKLEKKDKKKDNQLVLKKDNKNKQIIIIMTIVGIGSLVLIIAMLLNRNRKTSSWSWIERRSWIGRSKY